jgi:hypothetical protein
MAAITPATVVEAGAGPYRLLIASFTTVSTTDTWTSGIKGIVGLIAQSAIQTTQASAGCNVVVTTASTGLITFNPGEDGHAVTLYVIGSK